MPLDWLVSIEPETGLWKKSPFFPGIIPRQMRNIKKSKNWFRWNFADSWFYHRDNSLIYRKCSWNFVGVAASSTWNNFRDPKYSNHQAPNQQFPISWKNIHRKKWKKVHSFLQNLNCKALRLLTPAPWKTYGNIAKTSQPTIHPRILIRSMPSWEKHRLWNILHNM